MMHLIVLLVLQLWRSSLKNDIFIIQEVSILGILTSGED